MLNSTNCSTFNSKKKIYSQYLFIRWKHRRTGWICEPFASKSPLTAFFHFTIFISGHIHNFQAKEWAFKTWPSHCSFTSSTIILILLFPVITLWIKSSYSRKQRFIQSGLKHNLLPTLSSQFMSAITPWTFNFHLP